MMMITEITDFDKESDKQLVNLMDEIEDDIKNGVKVLCEYMAYMVESDNEEFWEDWSSIVSSAFHAPWKNRHTLLNRQIDKAIDYVAVRRAAEELK